MDASLYCKARNNNARLRIGLLLDSLLLPRWFVESCDHIIASNFASIELVIVDSRASHKPSRATRSPLLQASLDTHLGSGSLAADFVLWLYRRWDRFNLSSEQDPRDLVDFSERLAHAKVMPVEFNASGGAFRIAEPNMKAARETCLDVLLWFGNGRPHAELRAIARCGIWRYHHGNEVVGSASPPYLRELIEGAPESKAALLVLGDTAESDRELCKGAFATLQGLSLARNCVQPYWGSSTFAIQKLLELHTHDWQRLRQVAEANTDLPIAAEYQAALSALAIIKWFFPSALGKVLARLVSSEVVLHWRIAFRILEPRSQDITKPLDPSNFTWIESPVGLAYADPFPAQFEGRRWIFFENFDYASEKGKISCAQILDTGLGEPFTVLERDSHLSYPFVFECDGNWYMIPEAAASGSVDLYRSHQFPKDWRYERTLIRGFAVDSTLFRQRDRYWLFTTFVEPRGGACQLWLYFSDSLAGNWIPHPMSPISTDVRYARGAGRIIEENGRLYRPSQDGRGEYGRSLIYNEILVLNEVAYREEPRTRITPKKNARLVGIHTYNRAESVECIDGKSRLLGREVRSKAAAPISSVFAKNALASWVALVYTVVTGFFLSPLVVSYLGATQYGVWSLIAGLVGYLGLLDLGIRQAVNKYTASLRAKGEHQECSRIVSAALRLFLILGSAGITLAGGLAVLAPYLFNIPEAMVGQARLLVLLSGIAIAISLVSGVFGGVVTGVERFDVTSGIEILVTTFRTMGTIFVIWSGYGIVALGCVQLSASIISCILHYAAVHRLYPHLVLRLVDDLRPQTRTILSFGISLTALYALASVIYLSDTLVIGALMPIESVAYFAIAGSLYTYAKQVPLTLAFLMTPRVSALETANSNKVGEVIIGVSRMATLSASAIAITFAIRGETFISLWMGNSFGTVSGKVLQVFAFVLLLDAARVVAVHSITGMGKQATLIRGYALEASFKLTLSIVLVQQIGIVGVALATLVSALFMAIIYIPHQLERVTELRKSHYLGSAILLPVLSCVPFGIATAALERYSHASRLDVFFLQMILVLPLVPLSAWFTCLGESEKTLVKSAISQWVSSRR